MLDYMVDNNVSIFLYVNEILRGHITYKIINEPGFHCGYIVGWTLKDKDKFELGKLLSLARFRIYHKRAALTYF